MNHEKNNAAVNGEELLVWFEETMQSLNENQNANDCLEVPVAVSAQPLLHNTSNDAPLSKIIEIKETDILEKPQKSIELLNPALSQKSENDLLSPEVNRQSNAIIESADNWATTFVPTMYEAVLTSNAEMVEKPVVDVEAVNSDCSANNCTDSSSSDDSTSSSSTTSSDSDALDSDSELVINENVTRMEADIPDQMISKATPCKKSALLGNESTIATKSEISVPNDVKLETIGKISSIIANSVVVVKALPEKPALNLDSVLFLNDKSVLGQVYDTFGPVSSPFYVVSFEDGSAIPPNLALNQEVLYAPNVDSLTSFVFMAQLRNLKGSDASWFNDQEPPDNMLDYSDDEQEREAKLKLKQAKQQRNSDTQNPSESGNTRQVDQSATTFKPRKGRGRGRGKGREVWSNRSIRYVNPVQPEDAMQSAWIDAFSGLSARRNAQSCPTMHQMSSPQPFSLPHCNPPMNLNCAGAIPSVNQVIGSPMMNRPPPFAGMPPYFNSMCLQNNSQMHQRPPPPPPPTPEAFQSRPPFVGMPSMFTPPPPPPPPPQSDITNNNVPDVPLSMLFSTPPTE